MIEVNSVQENQILLENEGIVVVEINDTTSLQLSPSGVFAKIFEMLFSLMRKLGYEHIKIEVRYDANGTGDPTDQSVTNTTDK